MLEKGSILCIYNYLSVTEVSNSSMEVPLEGYSYYILHIFDATGVIAREYLHKAYFEKYQKEISQTAPFGPFDNLNEMHQFAYMLMGYMDASRIYLLSVADYNGSLEDSESTLDLFQKIVINSTRLENMNQNRSSKGLFGKIFD